MSGRERKEKWIVCSTYGLNRRGFEAYTEDLHRKVLEEYPETPLKIIKGYGQSQDKEARLWNIFKYGAIFTTIFAKIAGRSPYGLHLFGFSLSLFMLLLIRKPVLVYLVELPVYKYIQAWNKFFGQKFTLIAFSGGQITEHLPFDANTILHYVTPPELNLQAEQKMPAKNQKFIPHFVNAAIAFPELSINEYASLKTRLNIPAPSKVVLSVGSIDPFKGMDHLIKEVSALRDPDIYLLMLGQPTPYSNDIKKLADQRLPGQYLIASCGTEEVYQYYEIADLFVLCSKQEGFGLVYLEALAHGLPVIAHDFPIARYVLGNWGAYTDMSQKGALATLLKQKLEQLPLPPEEMIQRRQYVKENFSWEYLKAEYLQLLQVNSHNKAAENGH